MFQGKDARRLGGRARRGRLVALATIAAFTLSACGADFGGESSGDGPYYDGKKIKLLVPFSPGGGADTTARLLAPLLQEYIPGNPSVYVENRGGAGGITGSNHFTEREPHDGTTILVSSGGAHSSYVVQDPAVKYEFADMIPLIGVPAGAAIYVRSDTGITEPEGIVGGAKVPLIFAGQAPSGGDLRKLLAMDLLEVDYEPLFGYEGAADANIAFDRNEANIALIGVLPYLEDIMPRVAALALCERTGAAGRALITAYAVGWDVQQRLRAAGEATALRAFHPPGVVGPLGAAAAAASVLGLEAASTAAAFGLAASRTGGLFANNGTMAKATHPGGAARSGVECADLAALGVTANPEILDAHRGLADALFGGEANWDVLTGGLGTTFHLVDPGFTIKRYPAEIYMQWPIEAMATLRERTGLSTEDIESIVVEPPLFRRDLSRPAPESGLDGKFSYEYCVTVALTEERVGIGSFTDEVRFSPAVRVTLPKVALLENPEIPRDKLHTWSRVTVRTRDGRELTETCRRFLGAIGRPMDRDTRLWKVTDCLTEAGAGDRVARLVAVVERLEEVDDLTELTSLLS
ncbi:MmgE/PrpD family protein [Actinophytocola sp.]|uniref:MmgE/PrpD family protein n=1 Tax=Actinophytocola sp. TaxID=1872138 RepID=UPI003D6A1718